MKKKKIFWVLGIILILFIFVIFYCVLFFSTVNIKECKTPVNEIIVFKYPNGVYRSYIFSKDGIKSFFLSDQNEFTQCSYSLDSIYVTLKGESNHFWRIFKPLEFLIMKYRGIKPIILSDKEFEEFKKIRENNKHGAKITAELDAKKTTEKTKTPDKPNPAPEPEPKE